MDPTKNLIIAKNHNITSSVTSICYSSNGNYANVTMNNGKTYSYNKNAVIWFKEPELFTPNYTHFYLNGKILYNIEAAFHFIDGQNEYWHICFSDGKSEDYNGKNLKAVSSCLTNPTSNKVFTYLKNLSECAELKGDDGTKLLAKQYEKLSFIEEDTALAAYLNPESYINTSHTCQELIFPFGCNSSQFAAVKNALENKLSVIQGPPGTGKTQTILNIIANLIIQGKTIQVVSNNNSAISNIFEKMSSEKYGLDFILAFLGSSSNKKVFIDAQNGLYPDISGWKYEYSETPEFVADLKPRSTELGNIFLKQERLALIKQELATVQTEYEYFKDYYNSTVGKDEVTAFRKKLKSNRLMNFLQECQNIADSEKKLSFLFKIKSFFVYGISDFSFYKKEIAVIINTIQNIFYTAKIEELQEETSELETYLETHNAKELSEEFSTLSMKRLKHHLYKLYGGEEKRKVFSNDDLWKNYDNVLKEYPIILSTTFSSRSSLCKDASFDYLIMDEASQVDVATGALALSCAKNAVIVGDTKQLPNVVKADIAAVTDALWSAADISPDYNYSENSFLKSVCNIFPDIPQTLLREHYRCHSKIINFCNQKFYNNELVIMSQDHNEKDVLNVIKTLPGNHARGRTNQRQVDVIECEILPRLEMDEKDIGIIAPYNAQVNAIKETVSPEIDVATVHKFQGREKNAIIISTVDNKIGDFVDDPYLLNVAISRAKEKLYLVVSGNEQESDRNIVDLISYIEYNNFAVKESRIFSIFDYLYQQYSESRKEFLQKHKRISEYDSENLMYGVIEEVLYEQSLTEFGVVCHFQLNMLIRDPSLLNDTECKYIMNSATHVDFLIYNKIRKTPVLAIEVDGYSFHKEDSVQAERDIMKNHILDLYGIPYLRLSTTGSREKEKLTAKLKEILKLCYHRN